MAPKPKFKTLTTTGRLAKDAYEREQRAAATKPTPDPSEPPTNKPPTPPPPKKKRRITNHAPPGERAAEAAAKALAREKKKAKRKAPLTTKEKQAAHAARQRKARQSVVHDGSSLRVLPEENGAASAGERVKGSETRNLNLMDFMRELGQMSSSAPVQKGRKKAVVAGGGKWESVLVRATEKTKRLKVQVGGGFESKAKGSGGPGLMSLSLKLRERIWREVVVETRFFVYPASSPEQPDLAMTSRQIRGEVLPIYYGENTFAVEVPSATAKGKKTKASPSLKPVQKWANALQDAKHLEQISKWAFIWAPPTASSTGETGSKGDGSNGDAIIRLEILPASTRQKKKAPKLEIHRQAFCMLSDHEQHVPCLQKAVPKWLTDAVAGAMLVGSDRGEQVVAIAKVLTKKGGELVESRCDPPSVNDTL